MVLCGNLAICLVQFAVSGLQHFEHCLEDRLGRSNAAFEFFVGQLQLFLNAGHFSTLKRKVCYNALRSLIIRLCQKVIYRHFAALHSGFCNKSCC